MKGVFETLLVFLGYILVASGVYSLYLLFFKKETLPIIFKKWWFNTIIIFIAIAISILGWLLATKVIR